jgi:hypothetical protein
MRPGSRIRVSQPQSGLESPPISSPCSRGRTTFTIEIMLETLDVHQEFTRLTQDEPLPIKTSIKELKN